MKLDHIVISVADLNKAINDYRALGFTVIEGGRHSAGTTENALITFKDGSYIELIAPTGDDPTGEGMDFRTLITENEGFSGFALHTENFERDVEAMKGRGVPVATEQTGSRTKPTGETLRWKMALIENTMAPFIIHDETPRSLRVSSAPEFNTHDNEVESVFNVTLTTPTMEETRAYYSNILGELPQLVDGDAVWTLANATLTLKLADTDALRQHYDEYRGAPYEITLLTAKAKYATNPPSGNTHGARLQFAARADAKGSTKPHVPDQTVDASPSEHTH